MMQTFTKEVEYSIQDLELLIERHMQNRYGENDYENAFETDELFSLTLEKEDADFIVYFLFYLLFNFPDRASYTALAIKKCYHYNILDGCYIGIQVYMNRNDFATVSLIEAILNNQSYDEIPERVRSLFGLVIKHGLPYSIEYLKKNGLPPDEI